MTLDSAARNEAWHSLHDPTTHANQLKQIASSYPEFAAAIGIHPNTPPELQRWAEIRVNHQNDVVTTERSLVSSSSPSDARSRSASSSVWEVQDDTAGGSSRSVTSFGIATMILVVVGMSIAVLSDYLYFRFWVQDGDLADAISPYMGIIDLLILALGMLCLAFVYKKDVWRILTSIGVAVIPALLSILAHAYYVLNISIPYWMESDFSYVFFPALTFIGFVVAYAVLKPVKGVGWIPFAATILCVVLASFLLDGTLKVVVLGVVLTVGVLICEILSAASGRVKPQRPSTIEVGSSDQVSTVSSSEKTNTLAILALILAFTVYVAGIIVGHVSLAQIRRTGERGRGLAIAALIIGYTSVVLMSVILIFYFSTMLSLYSSFM